MAIRRDAPSRKFSSTSSPPRSSSRGAAASGTWRSSGRPIPSRRIGTAKCERIMRGGDQTMTAKVHSLLTAAAVLAMATSALAGQAKKPAAKPAEKPAAAAPAAAPAAPAAPAKFVPPIRGEAAVQMTKPAVKRTGTEVVENFKVKNSSATGSIAGLKISEFWYDKDG